MDIENRKACFDDDLKIEAHQFEGIMQKFPNHFHEYYVIGFVKEGHRLLTCKNKQYTINKNDLVLFNPYDNHTCEQTDSRALDWRSINIKKEIMLKIVEEITGQAILPIFNQTIVLQSDIVSTLSDLHKMIMDKNVDLIKEETFYFLIEQLISEYTKTSQEKLIQISPEIQLACDYMNDNYIDLITLNDLSIVSGFNKYILLRNFTKQLGITPYQYLSTIRVNKAKNLLEAGITPIEVATLTGFSDQSHFSKFFKNFIGLTPKSYQNIVCSKKDRD